MACNLTITSVTGIGAVGTPPQPTAIRVTGTAIDCATINLVLRCASFDPGFPFSGTATVASDGTWTVDVVHTTGQCVCGNTIDVEATCASDPTCTAVFGGSLSCNGEPCPTVTLTGLNVGDCNPDGTRTVTVSYGVTGVSALSAELRDSTPTVLDTISGPGPLSGSGNYSGTVTFSVVVTSPPGCGGVTTPVSVPSCNGGGGGGGCGGLLPGLGVLVGVAAALTVLLLALQFCLNIPVPTPLWTAVIVAWAVVAVAIVAWEIICYFEICDCPSACDWLALAWMALLSAIWVEFYVQPYAPPLSLSGCCPTSFGWKVLILVSIILFVASFTYWLSRCHLKKCQVLDLLVLVFVSVLGVIFVYIPIFLPVVAACANSNVVVAAATIGAAFAVADAVCHNTGP